MCFSLCIRSTIRSSSEPFIARSSKAIESSFERNEPDVPRKRKKWVQAHFCVEARQRLSAAAPQAEISGSITSHRDSVWGRIIELRAGPYPPMNHYHYLNPA
jgi:hypothetical protein